MEEKSVEKAVVRGLLALEEDRARAVPLGLALERGEQKFGSLSKEDQEMFMGAPLIDQLLAKSWAARYDDPEKMISLAETARTLADQLKVRRYGKRVIADLRAQAWAELGNAYRVGDRLEAAGVAFETAVILARNGTGNPKLAADILDRWAVLLRDMRALPEAGDLLQEVVRYRSTAGDTEGLRRSSLSLALVYEESGEPNKAVEEILRVIRAGAREGWGEGESMLLQVTHPLAVNLVGAGEYELARCLLDETRQLYRRSGRLNQNRLEWLEGKIASCEGNYREAEQRLHKARRAFAAARLHYDAALVGLELALVFVQEQRTRELTWLVTDMIKTFRRLRIARELIASLSLLKQRVSERRSVEVLTVQVETIATVLREYTGRSRKAASRR